MNAESAAPSRTEIARRGLQVDRRRGHDHLGAVSLGAADHCPHRDRGSPAPADRRGGGTSGRCRCSADPSCQKPGEKASATTGCSLLDGLTAEPLRAPFPGLGAERPPHTSGAAACEHLACSSPARVRAGRRSARRLTCSSRVPAARRILTSSSSSSFLLLAGLRRRPGLLCAVGVEHRRAGLPPALRAPGRDEEELLPPLLQADPPVDRDREVREHRARRDWTLDREDVAPHDGRQDRARGRAVDVHV